MMVTCKEWTEKVMVPGDGSVAWEARMLVGLATWTAKSPGLVAGVGVEECYEQGYEPFICG